MTADDWLDQMQTVVELLSAGTEFTTDLLWSKVTAAGEPRMVGALMNRLARARLIEKTGEYQPTERPEAHSRPVPVWRRLPDGEGDPRSIAWATYRRAVEARFAAERAEAEALAHLQQIENEGRQS